MYAVQTTECGTKRVKQKGLSYFIFILKLMTFTLDKFRMLLMQLLI